MTKATIKKLLAECSVLGIEAQVIGKHVLLGDAHRGFVTIKSYGDFEMFSQGFAYAQARCAA